MAPYPGRADYTFGGEFAWLAPRQGMLLYLKQQ